MQLGRWPELELIYHTPNGEKRDKVTAARLKLLGVKPGVPDLTLPVARRGYFGFYLELKRSDGGNGTSTQQAWWLDQLAAQGYLATVAHGGAAAWKQLRWYLEGESTITRGIDKPDRMP